jgi:outer membrane protein OmpA-like peptidoglycan-associated protein/tetratricopeptide (TPR) repeat protein
MKYPIVLLLMISFLNASAQKNKTSANQQKSAEAYEKAMLQLRDGLIKDAVPLLGKAIEYDPKNLDAYLSLAGVYGELKNYDKAIITYETAKKVDSTFFNYYMLPYSINLAGAGRFNDAMIAVDKFLSATNLNEKSRKAGEYRKKTYQFALDMQAKHPATNYVFNPINLGDSVNSANAEYYPSFTIDDSLFVFTRLNGRREDFFQSRIAGKGWSKSAMINGDINEEPYKGALNISLDGEWLLFAGEFQEKGVGSYDIYISFNTPTGWSEPQNLGRNINTEAWETAPSLSPDKNALYFVSTRPGGYGGSDIYVSFRQPNGKWSEAVNMGPTVNTAGDEQAPFIHADNSTLYFTSSGLPGYGGSDIFVMKKNEDGKWGAPQNLGFPINTIENEGSLFVTAEGATAYYASDRADSRGSLDLYKFELREDVRPIKTLYVKGYVKDKQSQRGIPSAVELFDNKNNKAITRVQTDETGFYFLTLPIGKDYTFTVNRKGYLFYSDVFNLANKNPDSTYQKNILLAPITLNATVALKNIQFPTRSFQLESVSLIELNKLLDLMTDNPTMKVEISGHTDNVGADADNLKLSANRAKAVVDYLVSKGIDVKRMTSKGYGASKPIASNATDEGKALNRRTEFTITGL